MGKLFCLKCKATAEGDTFEDADNLINHAHSSVRCSGSTSFMKWNNESIGYVAPKTVTPKQVAQTIEVTKKKSRK